MKDQVPIQKNLHRMSMWRLVEIRIRCISLNVLRQKGRGGRATKLGSYHPCQAKHEASTDDDFYDGFVDYNRNRKEDVGEAVKVWTGPWHNNGHATTKLNMKEWETSKS